MLLFLIFIMWALREGLVRMMKIYFFIIFEGFSLFSAVRTNAQASYFKT